MVCGFIRLAMGYNIGIDIDMRKYVNLGWNSSLFVLLFWNLSANGITPEEHQTRY